MVVRMHQIICIGHIDVKVLDRPLEVDEGSTLTRACQLSDPRIEIAVDFGISERLYDANDLFNPSTYKGHKKGDTTMHFMTMVKSRENSGHPP